MHHQEFQLKSFIVLLQGLWHDGQSACFLSQGARIGPGVLQMVSSLHCQEKGGTKLKKIDSNFHEIIVTLGKNSAVVKI